MNERPEVTAEWEVGKVGAVLKHDLRPGDIIVFRSTEPINAEQAHRMKARLAAAFQGHECVILAPGASIEVVRPEAEE